ncbi:Yos1-like protein [Rhodotorula diobovata]|uniref:Yos1-like protein n=1 Tax=Rhodotorula diobovata TaxID=5288 RepID=A0A5C5G2Q7_9BASI|nr:Yos1-like protein [Rhodotorula diobovata]
MGVFFGLGSVAYFALLMINAVAILNKERFLAPLGLTTSHFQQQQSFAQGSAYSAGFDAYGMPVQGSMGGGGGGEAGVKMRAVQLVDAVRTLMRIPLIPINIVVIFYEVLFG